MEYTPRYPQPFTLGEAVGLDVPVISEEIARLQNSLAHLKSTQEQLKEATEELSDAELEQAMKENDDVIGSQEERISILRMALAEKGLSISCHSELPTGDQTQSAEPPQEDSAQANSMHAPVHDPTPAPDNTHNIVVDEDGGIDL